MYLRTKLTGITAICLASCLASGGVASSQDSASPSAQDCRASPVQQTPGGKTTEQSGDVTDSTKLKDCGGVIKPPETGDGTLVQPAPPASNMPVVKPNDLPSQQQNAK